MTPPDTNLKKQKKRHKGPLIGMAVGVTVAVLLLGWFISRTMMGTPETDQAPPEQVIDSTGIPAEGAVSGPDDTGAPQIEEPDPALEEDPVPPAGD